MLSDDQWEKIAPLLRGKVGDRGRSGNDNRAFIDAVLWIARTGFENITPEDIIRAMQSLNHRTRKCLNVKTPHEVFMEQLKSHQYGVALRS